MRIAIIAPTYLPARRANTFQVMKMAQALALGGHSVRLAVPSGAPVHAPASWQELAHLYGLVQEFPIEWLYAHPRMRRHDYGLRSVIWARLWNPDLVYTRLPQAAALASSLGIKTVFEIHDVPQGKLGPLMFRRFLRGRGARRLVVISRALAGDLAGAFGAPEALPFTLVAADGVDLGRYAHLPRPEEARRLLGEGDLSGLQARVDRFTAGYTGHLYPGRGVELLLALAARHPEVTFMLAGGNPEDISRLQERIEAGGLENVVLAGFVANAELPLYQAACDVLLMPYGRKVAASSGGDIARYLSPMKLFEYLASGRAILSSDLPVLREVLCSDNAILLPAGDVAAWSLALQKLAEDGELRSALGRQARRTAEQHTWEARAARILEGIGETWR